MPDLPSAEPGVQSRLRQIPVSWSLHDPIYLQVMSYILLLLLPDYHNKP